MIKGGGLFLLLRRGKEEKGEKVLGYLKNDK